MKQLLTQFARFGVVGTLAFLIDYAVLMLLTQLFFVPALPASVVSFCVSLVFNYLASMRFVFARREELSRRREFIVFCILSVIGLGINSLIIGVGSALFGQTALPLTITKVIATIVVALWNFVSRKRWIEGSPTQ